MGLSGNAHPRVSPLQLAGRGALALGEDDEIVVYCSNDPCVDSEFAYHGLVRAGYTNVRRYSDGLLDWQEAGFPLEGTAI